MAGVNIANIKPPKSPNLPIAPNVYSQIYFNTLNDVLRLYFNQLDLVCRYLITPDIGYYLNSPYGGFSDSTTQHILAINTPYAVTFNTVDIQDGPKFNSGNPDIVINPLDTSMIVIGFPGVYNYQFSLQLTSTNASTKTVYIWARINGVDVPNSATRITMSGNNNNYVAAWNWVLETFNSEDVFQLMWAANSTNVDITAYPATAFCPAIPSAILTVTAVSA